MKLEPQKDNFYQIFKDLDEMDFYETVRGLPFEERQRLIERLDPFVERHRDFRNGEGEFAELKEQFRRIVMSITDSEIDDWSLERRPQNRDD